jgi:hypothetical protein
VIKYFLVRIKNDYDGGGSIESFERNEETLIRPAALDRAIQYAIESGDEYYVIEGTLVKTNDTFTEL